MAKKKRKSKPKRRGRKPAAPWFPKEYDDLLNLSSLDAVAKSLGVSVSKLKCWRKSPGLKALNSGRPYNLGRVALELMVARHINQNQMSDLAQKGLAAHLASAAYKNAKEIALKTSVDAVAGQLVEKLNERSQAHGLTEEDWDELEQIFAENGYTDEWFDQHEDDEQPEIEGV